MAQDTSNLAPLAVVDSMQQLSNAFVNQVTAYLGQKPVAWGRYFTTTGGAEYSHSHENGVLHSNNIRLLPVARHTNHVGGSHAQGVQDAQQGVKDFFATFDINYLKSQGNEFFMFLDVEGNATGPNGSISEEYYQGWSESLIVYSQEQSGNAVTLLPCVYANYHDDITFNILTNSGFKCYGLWIARYYSTPSPQPAWSEHFAVPAAIQQSSIPVFLRQYAAGNQVNQAVDLDQTNPNIADIQSSFLDKLVLPPAGPVA